MRILIATTAGVGHFFPLVPVAWAAQRAGHEVRVAAPPALTDAVTSRGLTHLPLPDLAERHQPRVMAAMRAMSVPATAEQERAFVRENFGWAKTDAALAVLLAAMRDWRPDLVVHEAFERASVLAAQEFGVRHAAVAIGLRDMMQRWLPGVVEGAAEAAADAGLEALADAADEPLLSMLPPSLDSPGAASTTVIRYRGEALHRDAPTASPSGTARWYG